MFNDSIPDGERLPGSQWLCCSLFAPSAHSWPENLLALRLIYHLHTKWVRGQKICTKGLVWLALKNACRSRAITLSGHVEAMSQTQRMITAQASALRSTLLPGAMTGLGGL